MGFVYVVKAKDYVKIGITDGEPEKRFSTLQTGCPEKFIQTWYAEAWNPRTVEKIIHEVMFKKHVNGEWYSVSFQVAVTAVKIACEISNLYESKLSAFHEMELRCQEYRKRVIDLELELKRKKDDNKSALKLVEKISKCEYDTLKRRSRDLEKEVDKLQRDNAELLLRIELLQNSNTRYLRAIEKMNGDNKNTGSQENPIAPCGIIEEIPENFSWLYEVKKYKPKKKKKAI